MIIAIVFAVLAYRKAKDLGRSGFGWAAIAGGVFVGTQLVVSLGFGFLIGILTEFGGWEESAINIFSAVATIASIALSILTGWLVLRHLDRLALRDDFIAPPPPPDFRGS